MMAPNRVSWVPLRYSGTQGPYHPRGPSLRQAVRAIVTDEAGRLLLVRFVGFAEGDL
jgi:hypothetical protein